MSDLRERLEQIARMDLRAGGAIPAHTIDTAQDALKEIKRLNRKVDFLCGEIKPLEDEVEAMEAVVKAAQNVQHKPQNDEPYLKLQETLVALGDKKGEEITKHDQVPGIRYGNNRLPRGG